MYVTTQQSKYLKSKKENLQSDEAIVQLDFRENFKYVIQDDIQQRFWYQSAVTLHPVMFYVKNNDKLIHKNYCIFSDDLKHDVPMVKTFIKKILQYIKDEFTSVKKVEFFSHGCGGQYKNCEVFNFLYHCQQNYNLLITWNFFTTAHGKSACDGIGGIIKRLATIESLKRPYNNHIISLIELLKFCHENIQSVLCVSVSLEEIE